MRPSGHAHATTIALALLYFFISNFNLLEAILFLSGSLLLDGDFVVTKIIFKMKNHRDFITHSYLIYLILIILSYIFHLIFIWLFLGALYHLCFDVFDWGLPILPFNPDLYVTPHLLIVPSQLEEVYFFKTYFRNKFIYFLEIFLFLGFIVSILFLPLILIVLVSAIEIMILAEFLFQFTKSKALDSKVDLTLGT